MVVELLMDKVVKMYNMADIGKYGCHVASMAAVVCWSVECVMRDVEGGVRSTGDGA